jgi:hypothetical protein
MSVRNNRGRAAAVHRARRDTIDRGLPAAASAGLALLAMVSGLH